MEKIHSVTKVFIDVKSKDNIYDKDRKTVNYDLVLKDETKPATINNLIFMDTQKITRIMLDCGKDLYKKIGANLYNQTYNHMYDNSLESAIGLYDINTESCITKLMNEEYQILNCLYDNSNYQEMLKYCALCIKLFIITDIINKVESCVDDLSDEYNKELVNPTRYTDENKKIKDDRFFLLKFYINNVLPNGTGKITYGIIEKAAILMFTDLGQINNIPDTINDTYFNENDGSHERKRFHKNYISAVYNCIDKIILKKTTHLRECKHCGYYLINDNSKVQYHEECWFKKEAERKKKEYHEKKMID